MSITTYGVYAIELEGEPGAVYVGHTAKTLDERLAEHNAGGDGAARIFRRGARGSRLREDLHGDLPRYATRNEAKRAERRLANQLKHRGLKVTVGI